jgi:hypothetical protein
VKRLMLQVRHEAGWLPRLDRRQALEAVVRLLHGHRVPPFVSALRPVLESDRPYLDNGAGSETRQSSGGNSD